ncbi:MAG: SMC-Scp complex subunit ScpB [Longimicrobiales bacterium]
MNAHQIVEAVLFAADAPLTAEEIARADESLDEDAVEQALQFLRAEYDDAERAFQVVEVAEGYQVLTRPEFAPYLERFDNVPRPSRLSGPALETLAIIAYRQPLGRVEIEYIRGVGASGVIKTLQDRQLIEVVGRAEGLGRPLLYGTTKEFLQHFGFRSLEDLPRPEELPVVLRERTPLGLDDDEEEAGDDAQEELGLAAGDGTDEAAPGGAEDDADEGSDEADEAEGGDDVSLDLEDDDGATGEDDEDVEDDEDDEDVEDDEDDEFDDESEEFEDDDESTPSRGS